ncbi:hypothetical protein ACLM5H_01065 [Fredinandcohnia humi]
MGYILPINHEQYNQYMNRTTSYQINNLQLHRIQPTSLKPNPKTYHQKQQVIKPSPRKKLRHGRDELRAQITGLGLLYDSSI